VSAPIRFLVLAVTGWTVVRATALGAISGFTVSYATPVRSPPPLVPTQIGPYAASDQVNPYLVYPTEEPQPPSRTAPVDVRPAPAFLYPAYYPPQAQSIPAAIPPRPAWRLPAIQTQADYEYAQRPPLPAAIASEAAFPPRQSSPVPIVASKAQGRPKLDRWQVSSWALLRGASMPGALASGGTLGGSQGGARILYNISRSLAASIRTSSPLGGSRGAEIAAGIRWAPFHSIPIAITAERRQSISRFGGRSDFALFVEGGLYRRPMPLHFRLDGYFQAGVVGIGRRDLFADGQLAVSRPVWGRFSAGMGVWGGVQPGLYRVDAGPRVSMRVRDNIYAHVDWRQRLAGSALPASGPALTLAADF
jgi:hypothetical protein